MNLSESAKYGQFIVRHAHVHFVALHVCFGNRLEFRCGNSIQELLKAGQVEVLLCPGDEASEILLVNATNGVDIRTGAIVFRLVAS